jgi:hypothetical protein
MEASETLPRAGVIKRTTHRESAGSGFNPQAGRPFPACRGSGSSLERRHAVNALVEFLKQFLYTLGGTAVAVAAVAWLARSVVKHWLSKDVETYKNQLKAESETALERLRSELQILAARRNIEYSRIHEKRLEIISELAGKIRDFHEKVTAYTAAWEPAGGPSKEERRKLALTALAEFNKYFLPRSFFLPKKTVQKIEAFRSGLQLISTAFFYLRRTSTPAQTRFGQRDRDLARGKQIHRREGSNANRRPGRRF